MPFDSELTHSIPTLKIIRLTSRGENKEFLNAEKYNKWWCRVQYPHHTQKIIVFVGYSGTNGDRLQPEATGQGAQGTVTAAPKTKGVKTLIHKLQSN